MSATLMAGFLIITFRFDESNFYWMWEGRVQVPIIIGISAIVSGIFWVIEQKKLNSK